MKSNTCASIMIVPKGTYKYICSYVYYFCVCAHVHFYVAVKREKCKVGPQ